MTSLSPTPLCAAESASVPLVVQLCVDLSELSRVFSLYFRFSGLYSADFCVLAGVNMVVPLVEVSITILGGSLA